MKGPGRENETGALGRQRPVFGGSPDIIHGELRRNYNGLHLLLFHRPEGELPGAVIDEISLIDHPVEEPEELFGGGGVFETVLQNNALL